MILQEKGRGKVSVWGFADDKVFFLKQKCRLEQTGVLPAACLPSGKDHKTRRETVNPMKRNDFILLFRLPEHHQQAVIDPGTTGNDR